MHKKTDQKEGFTGLIVNIIIPTLVLNKLGKYLGEHGALIALAVALIFPLAYGIRELIKSGDKNLMSIFGVINILLTGGLALLQLEGIWFAVKEAAIPALIGIFVYISSKKESTFLEYMLLNDSVVDTEKMYSLIDTKEKEEKMDTLLKRGTVLFSLSFFLSSLLNFILAKIIFTKIPLELANAQRMDILNKQIAEMTWKSYIVIMIPCLVMTIGIMTYIFKEFKKITNHSLQELFHH